MVMSWTPCATRDSSPEASCTVQGYELDFALQEHGLRLNVEVEVDGDGVVA